MSALTVALLLAASAAQPCSLPSNQKAASGKQVVISGEVAQPLTVAAGDIARFPTVEARLRQPSELGLIEGRFEGIAISDLLAAAGAKQPDGKSGLVDAGLLAKADDGYRVFVSFAEASPGLHRQPAFVAFRCNGGLISPTLVVPGDLTSVRYVHELVELRFVTAP